MGAPINPFIGNASKCRTPGRGKSHSMEEPQGQERQARLLVAPQAPPLNTPLTTSTTHQHGRALGPRNQRRLSESNAPQKQVKIVQKTRSGGLPRYAWNPEQCCHKAWKGCKQTSKAQHSTPTPPRTGLGSGSGKHTATSRTHPLPVRKPGQVTRHLHELVQGA